MQLKMKQRFLTYRQVYNMFIMEIVAELQSNIA